jgi:hypothetical protein
VKDKKFKFDLERNEQKFRRSLREHSILTGIEINPNNIINNIASEDLTAEEEHVYVSDKSMHLLLDQRNLT